MRFSLNIFKEFSFYLYGDPEEFVYISMRVQKIDTEIERGPSSKKGEN